MFLLATLVPFIYIYLPRKAEKNLASRKIQLKEELQVARGKLLQAERLVAAGTIAAGMAHEIKNPLTSIKIFTEFLDKKFEDKDFRDKF